MTRKIFDGLDILLGVWLAISATLFFGGKYFIETPYMFPPDPALWATFVLGVAVFVSAFWGEMLPSNSMPEMIDMILGALVFLSPWLLDFGASPLAAWNNKIVGVLLMVCAALAMPRDMMHRTPHTPG